MTAAKQFCTMVVKDLQEADAVQDFAEFLCIQGASTVAACHLDHKTKLSQEKMNMMEMEL